MKAVVASGHPLTCQAAAEMLQEGGNAFDAAIAAGFATVATEPTLSSLGGGGFLLAHVQKDNKEILFDFFVNTPGLGLVRKIHPHFFPITVRFRNSVQDFHIGMGSVAVPGVLKGFLHVHKRLGILPLRKVIGPSIRFLNDGVVLNPSQAYFLKLLRPIITLSKFGQKLYLNNGHYIKIGDIISNPCLATFLGKLFETGDTEFYRGRYAVKIEKDMLEGSGFVTATDLDKYRIEEREPLKIGYKEYEIITNPLPSYGGVILGLFLKLLENINFNGFSPMSLKHLSILSRLMHVIKELRGSRKADDLYPLNNETALFVAGEIVNSFSNTRPSTSKGTTHISVLDKKGNAASMTISNGEGSGYYVPDTGIMLNNMLGEDDLYPEGFHAFVPGIRVSSMMSPTIVKKKGDIIAVIGSGGSKRIKTAISQVIINLLEFSMPVQQAVECPRIHLDDEGMLQIEKGVNLSVVEELAKSYPTNLWSEKNMYFGGVHVVAGNGEGWGDSRRGGAFLQV